MTKLGSTFKGLWAPQSCSLPTAEQPLRQHQFAKLFLDAVTAVDRLEPTHGRLTLRPDPQISARAADLCSRETECCSFFTFNLKFAEGRVLMDISVPSEHIAVLDALITHAQQSIAGDAP